MERVQIRKQRTRRVQHEEHPATAAARSDRTRAALDAAAKLTDQIDQALGESQLS